VEQYPSVTATGQTIMWKLVGLSHLSTNEGLLILLVAICASLTVGWIMDMIMGPTGFGLFGNAIVAMIGIVVGVWVYHHFLGSMKSPDITRLMGTMIASVMLHLVVFSVLRRVLRL
jgi:uncharacterized membrane protein YeaQ/YmgE (transglycosylase-associated protein family)